MTTTDVHPSGEQHEITFGKQRATIVEVGGGVREYHDGDRPVLHPYDVTAICDGAHGAPLIPWPNRMADGKYRFDDIDYQVDLTEPEKHNAIHGFLRWRSWNVTDQGADFVTMAIRLHPMSGYPFTLDVSTTYRLSNDGLTVSTTATNLGSSALPYAHGQHPYLSPGDGVVDGCSLELQAETRIDTDAERQLPTGLEGVAGTPYDFREARKVNDVQIDYAFTDLTRDSDGRAWIRLTGTDGKTAAQWVDAHYPIIQVYTADTLHPDRRRRGLGAEPMTCPPNAFQTGEGIIRLEPGQSITTTWGVRLEG
ncbi:aldose 1-epimerase [Antricoccus suffuscus]|uniref:Aldose 1-epimerase n=1 Tax=Antricoccus suffuscus TaxID=1629062 RepID=A0A2T1A2L4_9ACTN|nr:aldose 1-epimerase family protein [Antricoccus suffuscus]PRZ42851.1 aldose 1-epimerase [Antricoccus suffuscus]